MENEKVLTTSWSSPSNIALIKYWGKHGDQLPCNPSISFTLEQARTHSRVYFYPKKRSEWTLKFLFEGSQNAKFEERILTYLQKIAPLLPSCIGPYDLHIETRNTFPHSAGIASSASALSSLALCFAEAEQLCGNQSHLDLYLVSKLARLGSGSACRSIFPAAAAWGNHPSLPDSSDDYAIGMDEKINDRFKSFKDYILIMDEGEKSVSSSQGHALMKGHAYEKRRYEVAAANFGYLIDVLESGDVEAFAEVVEFEALNLHGLMMLSQPSYTLMLPSTLEAIHRIRSFRSQSGVPLCFTLDAGPNLHLLFPSSYQDRVDAFVTTTLLELCKGDKIIKDQVGRGPRREEM